ncbi:MAG: hypothetical protein K0S93_1305, partial [Nitrososphaeraceae archaeon]|nr:hypothetical protein [Nitrososphaeraceae archaeon]
YMEEDASMIHGRRYLNEFLCVDAITNNSQQTRLLHLDVL